MIYKFTKPFLLSNGTIVIGDVHIDNPDATDEVAVEAKRRQSEPIEDKPKKK